MKKYNYLLSVLLVPAVLLQAGNTCTSGGGGSTPPTLTLPGSVTGIQTFNYKTSTLYQFLVKTVSSAGVFTAGTTYGAWCTDPNAGTIPGGGVGPTGIVTPPEDSANSTGVATYKPVNSYTISGAGGGAYGTPGATYDAVAGAFTSTTLTLAQEWSAVNWILNNPSGVSGETPTTTDTQAAIWQLLHPEIGKGFVVTQGVTATSDLTGSSWLLYKDALANGLSFVPTNGQLVGILMVPPTANPTYQGFVVPVTVTCTTLPGSATLTKTVNVGSAGANAFQKVTYTYTIKNTGSTTLQNLVIVDDNGTPGYTGDDVTINLPTGFTLAAGASYSVTSTVFLPISLFYQNGSSAAFDTLIPQEIPAAAGSTAGPQLLLTYLIDSDVSDNTYGKNASAGWAAVGGHTFADMMAAYAQFSFYPANNANTPISVLNVDYIGKGGNLQSGYQDLGVLSTVTGAGTAKYATAPLGNVDSSLSDNLNNYPPFNASWLTDSPVAGTPNWQTIQSYQVTVNEGIFGVSGLGSVKVTANHLNNAKDSFNGKCGYSKAVTYAPCIYGNMVSSTAYLCANVCGCSTLVHAKACLTVKLCGPSLPGCGSSGSHQCQNPVHCGCGCASCAAGNHAGCTNTTWWGAPAKCTAPVCACTCYNCTHGNHGSCTKVGCTDPICHANNCNHNTLICKVNAKPFSYCW